MKYDIKKLVDEIFTGAPDTKKAAELKEEIYQNLSDRYDELTGGGKSDREAMESIKAVMGDFNPVIAALDEKSTGTVFGGAKSEAKPTDIFPAGRAGNERSGNAGGAGGAGNLGNAGNQNRPGNRAAQQANYTAPKKGMSGGAKAAIIVGSIMVGLLIIGGMVYSAICGFANGAELYGFYFTGDAPYSIGDAGVSAGGVENVSVKWISGKVDVRFVEGDQITFREESEYSMSDDMRLRYRVKDGELEIMYGRSWNIFFGFWGVNHSKSLTLELPASMSGALDKMTIDTVSANINVYGLTQNADGTAGGGAANEFATLKIDTVSGNISVANISADSILIQTVSGKVDGDFVSASNFSAGTVSGDVNYTGVAEHIDFDSVSGNIKLHIPPPRSLDADTTSGVAELLLDSKEISGFAADFNSISGKFHSDYPTTVSGSRYVNGDGSCRIDFDSVSGELTIAYGGISSGN